MKSFAAFTRKSVSITPQSLVTTAPLSEKLGVVIRPTLPGLSLAAWAGTQRHWIDELLVQSGALLLRDFHACDVSEFERFTAAVSSDLLEYRERSSPRQRVSGNIYTSTDYPPEFGIFLHNENSYQQTWPLKIFFHCVTAALEGGETPIANCRGVMRSIPAAIVESFRRRGWMYVRNYGDGYGLPWQTVFQTDDRAEVEAHCRRHGISVEWKDGARLRTRAVRPAITRHPKTGEEVWFNHATFFHVTTLEPSIRESLLRQFDDEELPTDTFYGDGSPIEPEVLDQLRDAYRQNEVMFAWQPGDVLLLDNMLVAHGRSPYLGERKILVAMAEAFSRNDANADLE